MATIKEIEEFIEKEIPVAKSDIEKYQKHQQNQIRAIRKNKENFKQITFKVKRTDENIKIIDDLNSRADLSELSKGEFFLNQLENSLESIDKDLEKRNNLSQQIWSMLSQKTKDKYKEQHKTFNIKALITFLDREEEKPNKSKWGF